MNRNSAGASWEIRQFWQKGQRRLQPTKPAENTGLPGRKWWRGFFSIGSMAKDEIWP
jgi:hypothetical protein